MQQYIFDPIRRPLLPLVPSITTDETICEDTSLDLCLSHLEIIASNPSPTLITSLIQPLQLNLFLLLAYTQTTPQSLIKSRLIHLFQVYFTSSQSPANDILHLIDEILNRPSDWSFASGGHGGIAVKRNHSFEALNLDSIEPRIESVLAILEKVSENTKSEVFVGVVRKWFSSEDESDPML